MSRRDRGHLRRDGKLPVAEVPCIGREVAEGLAAAHERGLVHRDIKPGNLWLEGGRRRVKILDFGLARPAVRGQDNPVTEAGAVLGTPAYRVRSRPAATTWTLAATCSASAASSTATLMERDRARERLAGLLPS